MLDRNLTQSEISAHSRRLSFTTTAYGATDVLEELHDLLEEYAPAWYTQEQRERVESALRIRRTS